MSAQTNIKEKYFILKALLQFLQDLLIEKGFDILEISKILKPLSKKLDVLSCELKPEEILLVDILKLSEDFKKKFNLDMKIIF